MNFHKQTQTCLLEFLYSSSVSSLLAEKTKRKEINLVPHTVLSTHQYQGHYMERQSSRKLLSIYCIRISIGWHWGASYQSCSEHYQKPLLLLGKCTSYMPSTLGVLTKPLCFCTLCLVTAFLHASDESSSLLLILKENKENQNTACIWTRKISADAK